MYFQDVDSLGSSKILFFLFIKYANCYGLSGVVFLLPSPNLKVTNLKFLKLEYFQYRQDKHFYDLLCSSDTLLLPLNNRTQLLYIFIGKEKNNLLEQYKFPIYKIGGNVKVKTRLVLWLV